MTGNRWFDHSILVIIALNCITLAMERPAIPDDCTVSAPTLTGSDCFTWTVFSKVFL